MIKRPNKLPIISRQVCANINQDNILKIERFNRKINVTTDNEDYWYYGNMDHIEPLLNQVFYRCMDGCFLNMDRIESVADQTVVFD